MSSDPRPNDPDITSIVTTDVTDDLFYGGALRLLQPKRGHRFGGDAALLVAAARSLLTQGATIVDLGAGVGAVGLALAKLGAAKAVLVEIDPALSALSAENAARNGLVEMTDALNSDVAAVGYGSGAGMAELVATNPPFDDASRFRASPDLAKARAHIDDGAVVGSWIAAARRLLAPGGALVTVHRPEALGALLAALDDGFGDVRVLEVHPRRHAPAGRILLAARKGGRGPLAIRPPLIMHDAHGRFTDEAEAAQRGRAALDLS